MPEEEEMEREQKPIQHIQGKQSQGEQTSKLSEWGQKRRALLGGLVGLVGLLASASTARRAEPSPTAGPETLPTSTAVPPTATPKEPTSTPPPEPSKPLPEVISAETVKFESLPADQVQTMIDEAKSKGELKIPLPDILQEQGISLVEVSNKRGDKMFAITASKEGTFVLPALAKGKAYVSTGSISVVAVMDGVSGEALAGYIIPSVKESLVKILVAANSVVSPENSLVSLNYKPNTETWRSFVKSNQMDSKDIPENAIAIIAGKTGTSLTKENILTTLRGAPVIVGNPSK